MTFPGKTVAAILDNASIHSSKYIRESLLKYPDVKLFHLPTYPPEYNPAEQIRKWLKPLVHGAKTIENGCKEIRQRIRKVMHGWRNQRLAQIPNIGIGIWQELLFNYL